MLKGALYLRSSKDRSDVSIDAQRHELLGLAKSRQIVVVSEFSDAVESGKDDRRPGFQEMLAQLKAKDRKWNCLLALDTSRIARNQYIAHVFHYECEKRNIKVIYAKIPETGEGIDIVIRSIMQAFDQFHGIMSKEKGLAGMAENVRQGFRAGGSAPMGYDLEEFPTGAVRDGAPVTKTKLKPNADAEKIGTYLLLRADGYTRVKAKEIASLSSVNDTTLLGVEWKALTYAGHTVWGVSNERMASGGYKEGAKRKPRSEWVIKRDTHLPLISDVHAEKILARLERGELKSKIRDRRSDYLLSGILVNENGQPWHGCDGVYYRCGKGKRVPKTEIETRAVQMVVRDLSSDDCILEIFEKLKHRLSEKDGETVEMLRNKLARMDLMRADVIRETAEGVAGSTLVQRLELLEKHEQELKNALGAAEARQVKLSEVQAHGIERFKEIYGEILSGIANGNREETKRCLRQIIDKLELREERLWPLEIHYGVPTNLI